MKSLLRTQLLSVPWTPGNRVHFPVMNSAVSDSLAERAVARSCFHPEANVGYGVVRQGCVCVDGGVGMQEFSPGILQHVLPPWPALAAVLSKIVYGDRLLRRIRAAVMVKGAPTFPFRLS